MKKLLLIVLPLMSLFTSAQETYEVEGKSYELNKAIEGDLDLLWNTIDQKYRYFIRKSDGQIIELKNTRKDGKFQDEYKLTIRELDTEDVVNEDKMDLTLFDLRKFVDKHNMAVDPNYRSQLEDIKLQFRLEGFAGVTNNPFVGNEDNILLPQIGFSIEMIDFESLRRHALFLNGRQVFKSDDFDYNLTEFALGYRYRIIDGEKFTFYAQLVFGTFSYIDTVIAFETEEGERIFEDFNGTEFDAPLNFGLGADYRITERSFLTIGLNELLSATLENRGNFPINFTVGFKTDL